MNKLKPKKDLPYVSMCRDFRVSSENPRHWTHLDPSAYTTLAIPGFHSATLTDSFHAKTSILGATFEENKTGIQ